MIKVIQEIKVGDNTTDIVLYADTKAEVPATGVATKALIASWLQELPLPVGAKVYTSALDVAILKSDDTWAWA